MIKILGSKKSFTMVELMIVAVVVAILAVVVTPLMLGNKARAYSTEAETALGNIRDALRVFYAEYNFYPTIPGWLPVEGNVPGINGSDLLGTYFSGPNYTITSDANSFTILCTWNAVGNTAPRAAEISSYAFTTSLDRSGTFIRQGY